MPGCASGSCVRTGLLRPACALSAASDSPSCARYLVAPRAFAAFGRELTALPGPGHRGHERTPGPRISVTASLIRPQSDRQSLDGVAKELLRSGGAAVACKPVETGGDEANTVGSDLVAWHLVAVVAEASMRLSSLPDRESGRTVAWRGAPFNPEPGGRQAHERPRRPLAPLVAGRIGSMHLPSAANRVAVGSFMRLHLQLPTALDPPRTTTRDRCDGHIGVHRCLSAGPVCRSRVVFVERTGNASSP